MSTPSCSASASRNCRTVLVSTTGNSCRPTRATASASRVTALSSCRIEPCPGAAAGDQPQPGDALLGGLRSGRRRDGPSRQRDAEPADLADRLGAALEQLRVVVDQQPGALDPAGLLVGEEREHHVPRRPLPGRAAHCRTTASSHRVHVLHVDRAAAPDAAVPDLPGERVHRPLRRVGRDDVEVAVQQQRRPDRVGALDPGDHAGPARLRLVQPGRDPDLVSLPATYSAAARSSSSWGWRCRCGSARSRAPRPHPGRSSCRIPATPTRLGRVAPGR